MTSALVPVPRSPAAAPDAEAPDAEAPDVEAPDVEPPHAAHRPSRRILSVALGWSAALVVASPLLHVLAWRQQVAEPGSEPALLFLLVDTNGEQNLPAWWSAVLLLAAAGLAALRSALSSRGPRRVRRGWAAVAALLALLSLDEVASLHERVLGAVGRAAVGVGSGLLHFTWVVPGLALALALAAAAVPFLRALEPADRRRLVACGSAYTVAVLGVEAVSGAVLESGLSHAVYLAVAAGEEALEMGAVLALVAGLARGLRLRPGDGSLTVALDRPDMTGSRRLPDGRS